MMASATGARRPVVRLIAALATRNASELIARSVQATGFCQEKMPSRGARIFLIERPVAQPVEEHRGGAGQDHAGEHKKQMSRSVGRPLAATRSAPRAKGRAKIVCEKRISRRNRVIDIRSRQIASSAAMIQRSLVARSCSKLARAPERMGVPWAKSIRSKE